jgi:lipoyl(octanoyl) transferase
MIEYLWLGRVDYADALAIQQQCVELRHSGRIGNLVLLLEHPPVLTLGRNARRENILASDALLAARGITVHSINRGGDVTYHGPGQLVGYPIFDLRSLIGPSGRRLGPVDFVRQLEEVLIRLCGSFGILSGRVAGRTGVWVGSPEPGQQTQDQERKIAAIGVHIARGITSHGFALNVTTRLEDFQWIVPCGIADRAVTSMEAEIPAAEEQPDRRLDLETVANRSALYFGQVFGQQVLARESLTSLVAE